MAEHTLTPWHAAGDGSVRDMRHNCIPIYSGFIEEAFYQEPPAIANAAFIVKAVNCHDILVSALLMSRAVHQDLADNYEPSSTEHSMAVSAINTINAALTKAEA